MRGMKQSILLFAVLVFFVGCGRKAEAAAPEAQSKPTPKDAANPWDTPTGLALFMAEKIEPATSKASALSDVATALIGAGEKEQALATLKQALEVAQGIELAFAKAPALTEIATALAKAGEIKPALEVAQRIEDAIGKPFILSMIALALSEAGDKEQALGP